MATIGGANWGVTQSDRAAPRAAARQRVTMKALVPTSGKAIMRTSVGKWERSQNFAGKHGTIYCFHIRRRVLGSWVQFVNPLSRVQTRLCGDSARRGCVAGAVWWHRAQSHQVTWRLAKDLFSCCWRTNSQISFYRAKGLYSRPIGGASEQNVFASPSNTNIIGWFYVSEALHAKNFGTRRRIRRHLKTDDNVKCGSTERTWFRDTSLFPIELTIQRVAILVTQWEWSVRSRNIYSST